MAPPSDELYCSSLGRPSTSLTAASVTWQRKGKLNSRRFDLVRNMCVFLISHRKQMIRRALSTVLLLATTAAALLCSSGSCMHIVFADSSAETADQAHSCCGSPGSSNDGKSPGKPADSSPPDSSPGCGDCLFMAGAFDSKGTEASLSVPLPSVAELPDWFVPMEWGGFVGNRSLRLEHSMEARHHATNFWRQGPPSEGFRTRPELGVFLL